MTVRDEAEHADDQWSVDDLLKIGRTTVSTVTTEHDETKVEPRLYIFPHTGGSADFYVPFARAFTGGTKCVAVQYPGKRAGKDLSRYTSIPDLADRLCTMLKPADAPAGQVAFFGHSMGSLLAFEVALGFEQAGNPIAALFVSASAAPGRMRQRADLKGSDLELLSLVSDVTGANPEFLNNDQFAATILPTLRGLKAIASYDSPPEAKVSCPVYALMADNDELGTADLMTPWRERTTSDFEITVFPGDHFYIDTNLPQLAQWVEERVLARCSPA
jgi:surfactin synthase thioesterase subunit